MRKFLFILFLLVILSFTIEFRTDIQKFLAKTFMFNKEIEKVNNIYYLNNDFNYVKQTDDFEADSKQEFLNIMYTFLNSGDVTNDFFCDYSKCFNDIEESSNNHSYLVINNFIHPYNSFRKLHLEMSSFGLVSFNIEKTYSDQEIEFINQKIDEIINNIITDDMSLKQKITVFHDYIIKNTAYDQEYVDNNIDDIYHPSHTALGPLLYGKSVCGGYTDVMAIFLNKLGILNYKVSTDDYDETTDEHIWNVAYIDNTWYHIDLTWDDPGHGFVLDTFLLITDEELSKLNTGYHNYDKSIFKEL